MKTKIIIRFIVFLLSHMASGQNICSMLPEKEWSSSVALEYQATYEESFGVEPTSDGGFVITGYTVTSSYHNVFVSKYNKYNSREWFNKIKGSTYSEIGYAIKSIEAGGYMVTGMMGSKWETVPYKGKGDVVVFKLDEDGEFLFGANFGSKKGMERGLDLEVLRPNRNIVAGYTESDSQDVVGHHGMRDGWILMIDDSLKLVWQYCLGGSQDDVIKSVSKCFDGGFLVCGYTNSTDGNFNVNRGGMDAFVSRFSSSGALLWTAMIASENDEVAYDVKETLNGDIVVVGANFNDEVNIYDRIAFISKLKANGQFLWRKDFKKRFFRKVEITTCNDYLVFSRYRNFELMKINSAGDSLWLKELHTRVMQRGSHDMAITSDNKVVMVGYSYYDSVSFPNASESSSMIAVAVKAEFTNNTQSTIGELADDISLDKVLVVPNPAVDFTRIIGIEVRSAKVFSTGGKLLLTTNSADLDVSGFEKGLYLVLINNSIYIKLIKQ